MSKDVPSTDKMDESGFWRNLARKGTTKGLVSATKATEILEEDQTPRTIVRPRGTRGDTGE